MQTPNAHGLSAVCKPANWFFPVQHIGEGSAEGLLKGVGWRVATVFRRSFYMQSAGGDLICVGPLSLGPGPLNVLYRFLVEINWLDIGLAEDAPVAFDGRVLQVADRFVFDVSGALKWRPASIGNCCRLEAVESSLGLLKKFAARHAPRDSLGYLIPGFQANSEMEIPETAGLTVFQRACFNAAMHLKVWLVARFEGRDDRRPAAGIKSLLGLGPGLTPSGDDLLGGAFIGMHSLGRAELAYELWDGLQPAAQQRTNTISLAHLNWAARGAGAAAIHMTIGSLLRNHGDALADCLAAVGRIGHTSGWDTLAGIALAWQSYLAQQNTGRRRR